MDEQVATAEGKNKHLADPSWLTSSPEEQEHDQGGHVYSRNLKEEEEEEEGARKEKKAEKKRRRQDEEQLRRRKN